ncbi:MAG: M48 family metalloprotease [Polyangiaceae bacterium]
MKLLRRGVLVGLMVASLGCNKRSSQTGYTQYPPGQPPPNYPGQYPTQPGPGQPPLQQPPPGQPPQQQPPPSSNPPIPSNLPPVANDPINFIDINFMRQRSQGVLQELIAALPSNQRSSVQSVPLVIDDTVGEVNAFAACSGGKALMAITDGLMEVQSQMARAKATDEFFGTNKFTEYVTMLAKHQQPNAPIVRPQPSFWNPVQDQDGRKVARQHQLFDEELAFVLGHELAHHYLQHTGCVGPQLAFPTPIDIGRVLSQAVPGFNQPNEIAADQNGTNNLLSAGKARQGYHWTEGGALLTLNFFLALKNYTPAESILFAFELSHPHPSFRIPIVQQTAANWRASGGNTPVNPFPFPIPGFG